MKQTLIVTLDMTAITEARLQDTLTYLFAMPGGKGHLNLKFNLVDIDQEDVIAAEHALIDILERDRQQGRAP